MQNIKKLKVLQFFTIFYNFKPHHVLNFDDLIFEVNFLNS